jgi:glycosyltransferase involved in cell wall biosynthesis
MLELWVATFLAEALLLGLPLLWHVRRTGAVLTILHIVITTGWLAYHLGWAAGAPVSLLALLRLANLGRILKGRMNPAYLHHAVGRTAWWIFVLHVLLAWLFLVPVSVTSDRHKISSVLLWLLLTVATGLFMVTLKNVRKLAFKVPKTFLVDKELPTVTVAIPARNETTDLEECLRSVLASDYPKLEVIVLDDCSQGKTADIIKSFAHDGVRFVQGEEPAERWLAKNQAYQKLYEEANGDLVLFCGVDVRFGPHAIRSMVNVLHDRQKAMLSVLPIRAKSTVMAAFIQPMRYWWEISLPRRLFNRPPVLSTCWLIKRKALKHLGGFGSVSHAILPEGYFARELIKTDEYSFIRSSGDLDITTAKSVEEQRKTAIRMRYPQMRRRPEWALLLAAAEVAFLFWPFVLFVGHFFWWPGVSLWFSGLTCALLVATHVLIVQTTNPDNVPIALFNFPLVVLTEVFITLYSMIEYEYFTVTWKDRNICIPVMHVIPHLPSA